MSLARITHLEVSDIRFPTSLSHDGSDAMNGDPDYSAAYVVLRTDHPDGCEGHGFAFTIGRGNEVQGQAIELLRGLVVGKSLDDLTADMGHFARSLVDDSQLRWLGPEKGIMHMAVGAVVNAAWDLISKRAGVPLWRYLSELSPEDIVALVDFRYLTDVLTPQRALEILRAQEPHRAECRDELVAEGVPAYTTTPGWLGYSDDKLRRLCHEAVASGFSAVKLKVGKNPVDDERRVAIARTVLGPDVKLMIDANQIWEVDEAVARIRALSSFDLWWVEEPTSPDDIAGHAVIARSVHPIKIATGEHAHNRVMFKQFMAEKALAICQIDACRVGGVNENVAILLLAAHFGVPVCPHAGGVGLCEVVQHLSMFDAIAVGGRRDDRIIEFVDHLHEHFVSPVDVRGGAYRLPSAAGASTELKAAVRGTYLYPSGSVWASADLLRDVAINA